MESEAYAMKVWAGSESHQLSPCLCVIYCDALGLYTVCGKKSFLSKESDT